MHVPDGFLDAPTCAATGAVAIAGVAYAYHRVPRERAARSRVPMAGLVSALVFAGQMVDFPVGSGTSGHLLGGALAAVLLGPATAIVCIAGVLIVQAVLFADGGIAALGANVTLVAIVAVLAGWAGFRVARRALPPLVTAVPLSAGIGALVSVPVAAVAFTVLFALGGQAPVPVGDLMVAMTGWHLAIGVGEAIITAGVVALVMAARPDLVYGADDLPEVVPSGRDGRIGQGVFAGSVLAVTLLVAGVASFYASEHPDGLEYVAQAQGFDGAAVESPVSGWPLSDYAVAGLAHERLSVGLAGVAGCLVTLGFVASVARTPRRTVG